MTIIECRKCGSRNRVDEEAAKLNTPVCGKCGATLPEAPGYNKPQVVTDNTFVREVIEDSSSQPVLVDAWAEWCGPCRMIAPALGQLEEESGGRYKLAKLSVH